MTEDTLALPTIEEAREFLAIVNKGRVAIGLEPLDVLDFDNAEPSQCGSCLSATNVFMPAGYEVGAEDVYPTPEARPDALTAMGIESCALPPSILAVTDPFDERTPGLRERLVEAGVVAP